MGAVERRWILGHDGERVASESRKQVVDDRGGAPYDRWKIGRDHCEPAPRFGKDTHASGKRDQSGVHTPHHVSLSHRMSKPVFLKSMHAM